MHPRHMTFLSSKWLNNEHWTNTIKLFYGYRWRPHATRLLNRITGTLKNHVNIRQNSSSATTHFASSHSISWCCRMLFVHFENESRTNENDMEFSYDAERIKFINDRNSALVLSCKFLYFMGKIFSLEFVFKWFTNFAKSIFLPFARKWAKARERESEWVCVCVYRCAFCSFFTLCRAERWETFGRCAYFSHVNRMHACHTFRIG